MFLPNLSVSNQAEAIDIVAYGVAQNGLFVKIPVVPPAVRPSVKADNTRSEDDITQYITMKSKCPSTEAESKGTPKILLMLGFLLYNVATFVDNKIPKIPLSQQRSGRPIKALKESKRKRRTSA